MPIPPSSIRAALERNPDPDFDEERRELTYRILVWRLWRERRRRRWRRVWRLLWLWERLERLGMRVELLWWRIWDKLRHPDEEAEAGE